MALLELHLQVGVELEECMVSVATVRAINLNQPINIGIV